MPGQKRPPGDPAQIARGKFCMASTAGAATAQTCGEVIWEGPIFCARRSRSVTGMVS